MHRNDEIRMLAASMTPDEVATLRDMAAEDGCEQWIDYRKTKQVEIRNYWEDFGFRSFRAAEVLAAIS